MCFFHMSPSKSNISDELDSLSDNMRISLAQVRCALGDKEENLKRMQKALKKVDADLYVFAETYLTGYMCRDQFYPLAERTDGRSVKKVAKMAKERECSVIFGMPVEDQDIPGVLRNSAVCVSPDGEVRRYDKLFLANFGPFEEGLYFGPGKGPVMFDVNGTKVGAIICFDVFFPEITKSYALNGAEVVVCISASPVTSRPFFEALVPARAIENTIYMVYVNQVGTQLNQVYFGGSTAVGPRGENMVKNKYYEEDITVIETGPAQLEIARRFRPTVADTLTRIPIDTCKIENSQRK
jgi:5-aminopentanamidase